MLEDASRTVTAGAVELAAVNSSNAAIARKLGCRGQAVGYWRRGISRPRPRFRKKIHRAFGIRPSAWDRVLEGDARAAFLRSCETVAEQRATENLRLGNTDVPGIVELEPLTEEAKAAAADLRRFLDYVPDEPPPYPPPPENPSTLEAARYSLACVRHDLLHQRGLDFGSRLKLRAEEGRCLKLVHTLEQHAELSEDRFVRRHPAWLELRARIIAALVPYPDAAAAVLEAIGE